MAETSGEATAKSKENNERIAITAYNSKIPVIFADELCAPDLYSDVTRLTFLRTDPDIFISESDDNLSPVTQIIMPRRDFIRMTMLLEKLLGAVRKVDPEIQKISDEVAEDIKKIFEKSDTSPESTAPDSAVHPEE